MSREIGIIGDVHGNLPALHEIVEKAVEHTEKLVFVGDYIDKGPQSAEVVEYLASLPDQLPEAVFLRGNHEAAFMDYLAGGPVVDFLMIGGAAALKSYAAPDGSYSGADRRGTIPDSHIAFLERLRESYCHDGLAVTHSPKDPLPAGLERADSSVFRVAGHIPQPGFVPTVTDEKALIDTGSGMWADGRLTCLFWPAKDWIQA